MTSIYADKKMQEIADSTNTYYKLSNEKGSFYFFSERVVSPENIAGMQFIIKGAVCNGITPKVEEIADIKVLTLGYKDSANLKKIKLVDLVAESLLIVVNQWQTFIDTNKDKNIIEIPKREKLSRSLLEHIFNSKDTYGFMKNFVDM